MPMLMFHDEEQCDQLLDKDGLCPKCGYHPDMQSVGFKEITEREIVSRLAKGQTMMGSRRTPIE